MQFDPRYDSRIIGLRNIATRGGEYGPYYDRGVLHVIHQIDATGRFTPSPMRAFSALDLPDILTEDERADLMNGLRVHGLTVEQGIAFGRGIGAAETELADYRAA